MTAPFDQFAERIVRNSEYEALALALAKEGGIEAIREMTSALNAQALPLMLQKNEEKRKAKERATSF